MIWLGLAVYQTDINCRAYKNCRQSQIFFKKNVAKLLTTKVSDIKSKKMLDILCHKWYYNKVASEKRYTTKIILIQLSMK